MDTNLAVIVMMIVTNWASPIIPPAGWEQIQKMQNVPIERYRLGQVLEVKVVVVEDYQKNKQPVILEKKELGYIEQIGKATETIEWGQTGPIIKMIPKSVLTNDVASTNSVVQKKSFWDRFFKK